MIWFLFISGPGPSYVHSPRYEKGPSYGNGYEKGPGYENEYEDYFSVP